MPPILVGAAVVGSSIAGAAISGKATKKAAKTQAAATAQQITAANANRDYQYNLNAPTIERGGQAEGTLAGLYGLGDAAASGKALDAFKASTGYTARLSEGLSAVNNNRFAGGAGMSGATLKALQQTGQNYASNEVGNFAQGLGSLASLGANARGLVANVGNNMTGQVINASQQGAQQQGSYIMQGAQNKIGLLQNLANTGLFAAGGGFRSSYGSTGTAFSGDPFGTRGGGWYY